MQTIYPWHVRQVLLHSKVLYPYPYVISVPCDERLDVLKLQSLEYCRISNDLVLCYKILNGKLDADPSNVFKLNSNSLTRGHAFKLHKL